LGIESIGHVGVQGDCKIDRKVRTDACYILVNFLLHLLLHLQALRNNSIVSGSEELCFLRRSVWFNVVDVYAGACCV